jgi:hypothetical protein
MKRRRPTIEPKVPIFVGCEGASECAYVRLLQDFVREQDLPIHLVIEELAPGAGDPLARVEMAVKRLEHLRKVRTAPANRFIMLDTDQIGEAPARAEQARQLAARNNIMLVWQEPCFEAVLLRHLPNCATRQPPTSPAAEQALQQRWPGYEKPMTHLALGGRIDLAAIIQAASVEPDLAALLRCIRLIE